MTQTAVPATGRLTGPPPVTAGLLRRHRTVLVVSALVLGVLVTLTLLAVDSAGHTDDLDPQNPKGNGAQALARVLDQHGVPVRVVRRSAELARTRVDEGTTLLVTSTGALGRASATGLRTAAGRAGTVVLAAPGPLLVDTLDLPLRDSGSAGGRVSADCEDPLVGDLRIEVGPSAAYVARRGTTGCFPGDGRAALVVRVGGDQTGIEGDGPSTYAVGAVDIFANQSVQRADNAAAALRLLGQRDRLVWYVPDPRDVGAGDAGPVSSQLPSGLRPALWLVLAALLATMVWRGRRLGPLVVEQLPVVVKAIESTQGRGRLYRRVRDREHTAGLLRAATVRRLESRLRIPPGTGADRVTALVAEAAGADPSATYDVLVGRQVTDDATLVRLAADLTAIETEVHET